MSETFEARVGSMIRRGQKLGLLEAAREADAALAQLQQERGASAQELRKIQVLARTLQLEDLLDRNGEQPTALQVFEALAANRRAHVACQQERDALQEALEHVVAVLPSPIWNEHQVLVWSQLDIEKMRAALVTSQKGDK